MNKKLIELVTVWQQEHAGEELRYCGETILKQIADQESEDDRRREEDKARKEAEKLQKISAKKASETPRVALPTGLAHTNRPRTAPVPKENAPRRAESSKPSNKATPRAPPAVATEALRVLQELGV